MSSDFICWYSEMSLSLSGPAEKEASELTQSVSQLVRCLYAAEACSSMYLYLYLSWMDKKGASEPTQSVSW